MINQDSANTSLYDKEAAKSAAFNENWFLNQPSKTQVAKAASGSQIGEHINDTAAKASPSVTNISTTPK